MNVSLHHSLSLILLVPIIGTIIANSLCKSVYIQKTYNSHNASTKTLSIQCFEVTAVFLVERSVKPLRVLYPLFCRSCLACSPHVIIWMQEGQWRLQQGSKLDITLFFATPIAAIFLLSCACIYQHVFINVGQVSYVECIILWCILTYGATVTPSAVLVILHQRIKVHCAKNVLLFWS